jgi:hypothetical protein
MPDIIDFEKTFIKNNNKSNSTVDESDRKFTFTLDKTINVNDFICESKLPTQIFETPINSSN